MHNVARFPNSRRNEPRACGPAIRGIARCPRRGRDMYPQAMAVLLCSGVAGSAGERKWGRAMIARSFIAAVAAVAAVFASSAQATNPRYWDLWALNVGMICFAQNPAYRSSPLGNMVSNAPGFVRGGFWEGFDQRPTTACLRSRQWVSDRLCTDVTSLDETTLRNLGPLARKHEAELRGLQDVMIYQWGSPSRGPLPCPAGN